MALIINMRSRSGPHASRAAPVELERQGVRVRESHFVSHSRELTDAVRGAIARGVGTIVVGGGDGTVSSVIDFFANREDLTLGLLPVGTGNEVAQILGIPLDLAGACRVIARGRVDTVDLCQANGDFFIHTALVGYPAHVNHTVPPLLKLVFGKAAYLYSLLGFALGMKTFHVRVTAGVQHWEGDTGLLVVANARFHGPRSALLPRSDVAKTGLLIYMPRDARPMTILRLAIGLWITNQRRPFSLLSLVADSAVVITDPPQEVDLDGEFSQLTPVSLRLAHDALRILVPDSDRDDRA